MEQHLSAGIGNLIFLRPIRSNRGLQNPFRPAQLLQQSIQCSRTHGDALIAELFDIFHNRIAMALDHQRQQNVIHGICQLRTLHRIAF